MTAAGNLILRTFERGKPQEDLGSCCHPCFRFLLLLLLLLDCWFIIIIIVLIITVCMGVHTHARTYMTISARAPWFVWRPENAFQGSIPINGHTGAEGLRVPTAKVSVTHASQTRTHGSFSSCANDKTTSKNLSQLGCVTEKPSGQHPSRGQ